MKSKIQEMSVGFDACVGFGLFKVIQTGTRLLGALILHWFHAHGCFSPRGTCIWVTLLRHVSRPHHCGNKFQLLVPLVSFSAKGKFQFGTLALKRKLNK